MNYYRERNNPYEPGQKTPFKISRSKIELFMQCPRCFWLDVRLKITRPSTPPFNINKAIDDLFKKEFDTYRIKKLPHPIMKNGNVDAVPFSHPELDKWRHNFTGVVSLHEPTNLHIFGAIDDVWVNDKDELIVVDYKATAKNAEVNIDSEWQIGYKRQLEVYQWLFEQNGYKVCKTGYFVYTNAKFDADGFFDKVEFVTKLIPYEGSTNWVEPTIKKMKECMDGDMPKVGKAAIGGDCEYCSYAKARTTLTISALQSQQKNK